MKARVYVFYKDCVFDPQGNTLAESLKRLGYCRVNSVRVGKVVDVEITAHCADEAKRDLQKMCEQLLVNPVIESYQIEVTPQGKG